MMYPNPSSSPPSPIHTPQISHPKKCQAVQLTFDRFQSDISMTLIMCRKQQTSGNVYCYQRRDVSMGRVLEHVE